MKLSMAQIMIIVDTLSGSLAMKDDWKIFRYTAEAREELMQEIFNQASSYYILIREEEK